MIAGKDLEPHVIAILKKEVITKLESQSAKHT